MDKIRMLNKENITFVLRENFNFSDQLLNEVVEVVWNSQEQFDSPDGQKYLEGKGWVKAEDIKKVRIMQEQDRFTGNFADQYRDYK